MAKRYLVLISRIFAGIIVAGALFAFANVCAYVYLKPSLPNVDALRDVQLQVPLRIYTRDGRLIASIGEQRRIPVRYDQIPKKLIEAFLAAEDDRFFQHPGVDWQGILRAALADLRAGAVRQGGSTITMQVARDVFLTPRRDIKRKMSEIYISLRMESQYSKEDIFSIYANRTFLGERAYGVGAAAEVYFGKRLDQLSIAEMATLAGIPKAPSQVNPVANPQAARIRRAYVLRRMLALHYITQEEHDAADSSPVESRLHGPTLEVQAPYVAEMVRADMQAKYGAGIYTDGYKVVTTIDSRLQTAATVAVRTGLLEYDRRHGYRGPIAKLELPHGARPRVLNAALDRFPDVGGLRPAVVEDVGSKSARIFVKDLGVMSLPWEKLSWARRELPGGDVGAAPTTATQILSRGDVIYTVGTTAENTQFVQVPEAQSALVAIDPHDGAVSALIGGFDYYQSNFNRAVQARRQPGSAFKPFIYSAAFDKGFTPASVVLDAPIVLDDTSDDQAWRPKNDANKFYGPTRLREALVRSRNLVTVRLMREIGGEYARNYVTRFGFDKSQLPDDLTLALGTAEVSPLQLAQGYAAFANGGFRVTPYYIDRIEDESGKTIFQADPAVACFECGHRAMPPAALIAHAAGHGQTDRAGLDSGAPDGDTLIPAKNLAPQVIRPQVAYLLADMMADVIRHGTGVRARALNRDDVAGKTGTTNDHHDAWFAGFNGDLVATVWVGFDQDRSLGAGEEGGRTAVPIWTYFMHQALMGAPRRGVPLPDGVVTARINPQTGLLASADDPSAIMEKFIEGDLPKPEIYDAHKNANPMTDANKPLF
ncbi:MAG TPA: penicillin-binding protein 1A [Steroidobacteraceae bacterium]|nr:penicillin-binding protein 1A [Steroidobacteraceae bacterium]